MPTFIDESGDTGHSRTSSRFFRLAAVWMPSLAGADSFRAAVRELHRTRPDLHLDRGFEFKFARTHSSPERRRAFFELALNFDFKFVVCSIDKTAGHWRTAPAGEQHWATAAVLSAYLHDIYLAAQATQPGRPFHDPVLVDDNRDRRFLAIVRREFRGLTSRLYPGSSLVRNPRFRGSQPDAVMQLVDMVCGAAGCFLDGDREWFELIESRCLMLMRLP